MKIKKLNWEPEVMVTGERSIRFQFGDKLEMETYREVMRFSEFVEQDSYFLLAEIVPSYHTVTVYLKKAPQNIDEVVTHYLTKWREKGESESQLSVRNITIPVSYDEEFSFDMQRVMDHTKLTAAEIIKRHTKPIYTVFMLGFLPGFPYLGMLDEKLVTPRLATPRLKVMKGSVGIGGQQTGIYPLDSPGGWNMLGKTPLDLFQVERAEPFFLQAGDRLQFVSIEKSEFYKIKTDTNRHPEAINEFVQIGSGRHSGNKDS